MKFIIIILSCSFSVVTFAQRVQSTGFDGIDNLKELYEYGDNLSLRDNLNDEGKLVNGSIYLFDSWDGLYNIKLKNRKSFKLINLNYSLITNTLESKIAQDSVFQFNGNELESFDDGKKYYVFINNVLYQKLSEGKNISFYKNFELTKKSAVFNPLTQTNISEAVYVRENLFYLYKDDNLLKVKLNKKNILDVLSGKKDDIIKFVKLHSLSFSNEDDVIQILNHYNSL